MRKVDARLVELRAHLDQLRARIGECRGGDLHCVLRLLERVAGLFQVIGRQQPLIGEFLRALEVAPRLLPHDLRVADLHFVAADDRLLHDHVRLCGLHPALERRRIDHRQQLPFGHAAVEIDVDLGELARHLRTNRHRDKRRNRARRGHPKLDIAGADGGGFVAQARGAPAREQQPVAQREDHQCQHRPGQARTQQQL